MRRSYPVTQLWALSYISQYYFCYLKTLIGLLHVWPKTHPRIAQTSIGFGHVPKGHSFTEYSAIILIAFSIL